MVLSSLCGCHIYVVQSEETFGRTNPIWAIGGGARYWRINTAFAQSNRNDIGLPQTISLLTERWGGFVQASYKFGELRTLRY